MNRLPNFLVLGPPRTATTWLFRCIARHPQIYVPEEKEIHYFNEHYGKGVAWYRSFFAHVPDTAVAVGDLTPAYAAHPLASARIRETLGERVKLFVVFRDPVERAFSEYTMKKAAGSLQGSFLHALQTDRALVENSLYAKHLGRLRDYFADECLHVLSYRLLNQDPVRYLSGFLQALGVSVQYRPAIVRTHINEGLSGVRFGRLYRLSTALRTLLEALPFGGRWLWVLRERGVVRLWHYWVADAGTADDAAAEQRAAAAYFADDLANLQAMSSLRLLSDLGGGS